MIEVSFFLLKLLKVTSATQCAAHMIKKINDILFNKPSFNKEIETESLSSDIWREIENVLVIPQNSFLSDHYLICFEFLLLDHTTLVRNI